jgi:hypothetical protein
METIVRTIPELANNVITLTFSEFSLEAWLHVDFMMVIQQVSSIWRKYNK